MPGVEEALTNARRALAEGRTAQALVALQRALTRDPSDPLLNGAMAAVQARSGEFERAVYFAERAARAGLERPAVLAEFSEAVRDTGKTEDALRRFEALIAKDPSHAWARVAVGALRRASGRFVEGAHQMEAALEAAQADPAVALLAINDWIEGGQGPRAAALAARMCGRYRANLELTGLRAYFANYSDGGEDVFALHRDFGRMLQATVRERAPGYRGSREPGRRIRVGLLSPDFRHSAVAFFIEPFFEHRERAAFEIFGYSVALEEDAVSARLRAMADGWMHEPGWTDEKIAEVIERDGVDVLIDLAGLTGYSRLGVMAMRPAPVSATYLGYPNTTGLTSIDWRIVDATTDPPGSEQQSSEGLALMEGCFVCYRPGEDLPPVGERIPGPIRFGSFNNLLKFNASVARLWARVLAEVPGSRLVMKAPQLGDPGARDEVVRVFEDAGADVSRVELLHPLPGLREHLEAYARVDIALDTFPYCGTTTTCEALLMGVPVVSLRGDVHRGRVGASLLGAAGLSDLVAADENAYVAAAARLAGDHAGLAAMRTGLRAGLLGSALCDGPAWCRRFEAVLRRLWISYCEQGAPGARRSR